jgi:hypothetical protein
MKLFLRGTFALGILAALASTALSDAPTAPATKAPTMSPGSATTKPAQPTAATDSTGCSTSSVVSSGRGRIFGGRLRGGHVSGVSHLSGSHVSGLSGRLDVAGNRIDEFMQKGEERQQRLGELFNHLAGPPIDGQGQPTGPRTPKPTTQPGTVVFPQSPFVRSPRDYFMQD